MKKEMLAAAFLLLALPAAAHSNHSASVSVDEVMEQPRDYVPVYNSNTDMVPDLVRSLVGDERVNVHVESPGETYTIGLVMDGVKVDEVVEDGLANETVEIRTDKDTVHRIMDSDEPAAATVEAFNSGDIEYTVEGFGNQLKFGILSALMNVFGSFL